MNARHTSEMLSVWNYLFLRSQQFEIQVNLEELIKFPLTSVPYSLATEDGFFHKTDKSEFFHHLTKGEADAERYTHNCYAANLTTNCRIIQEKA